MVLDLLKKGRRGKVLESREEVVEVVPTRDIRGSRDMLSPFLGKECDFLTAVSLEDKSRGLIGWLWSFIAWRCGLGLEDGNLEKIGRRLWLVKV
jgi:hypothetical protein